MTQWPRSLSHILVTPMRMFPLVRLRHRWRHVVARQPHPCDPRTPAFSTFRFNLVYSSTSMRPSTSPAPMDETAKTELTRGNVSIGAVCCFNNAPWWKMVNPKVVQQRQELLTFGSVLLGLIGRNLWDGIGFLRATTLDTSRVEKRNLLSIDWNFN